MQEPGERGLTEQDADQHHMQRAQLLGRHTDADTGQQVGIAGTCTEYNALGVNIQTVDSQTDQLVVLEQRFNDLPPNRPKPIAVPSAPRPINSATAIAVR